MRINKSSYSLLLALCLAACGGGGGGGSSGGGDTGGSGGEVVTPPEPEVVYPKAFTVQGVNWIQVTKQAAQDPDTILSAGKDDTIFRVDVTGPKNTTMPANAELTLTYSDASTKVITLTRRVMTVPATVDNDSLNGSLFAKIAGTDITPALTGYSVNVPGATTPVTAGTVNVGKERTDRLQYRAISFDGQTGNLPAIGSVSRLIARTLPQTSLTAFGPNETWTPQAMLDAQSGGPSSDYSYNAVTQTHSFSQRVMNEILRELDFYCFQVETFTNLPSSVKCIAPFPSNVSFGNVLGLAANQSMITFGFTDVDTPATGSGEHPPSGDWLTDGAKTFVHEYGHLMSLYHANACSPPQLDSDLYSNGTLGSNGGGYDVDRGFYFDGASFFDFMSYCNHQWTSDRGYRKMVSFLASSDSEPVSSARRTQEPATTPDSRREMVVLSYFGGRWNAYYSPRLPILEPVTGRIDASFINGALMGVPVETINTHVGQLDGGPYYLPATPSVILLLKSGVIPGLKFLN